MNGVLGSRRRTATYWRYEMEREGAFKDKRSRSSSELRLKEVDRVQSRGSVAVLWQ